MSNSEGEGAMYELAVIGRGLIGTAAARHLAEAGRRVAMIGPGEPADYQRSTGPFASHYDEGRITRITASDAIWAELAARSIERYADIAARSGIEFHDPRGLAYASTSGVVDLDAARALGADANEVSARWLQEYTGIAVPDPERRSIVYEAAPAGLINPRRLIAAQVRLIEQAGGTVIDQQVTGLSKPSHRRGVIEVTTPVGTVTAERVLLCTGAYGAGLAGKKLELERRLRTIVLAELGPGDEIPSLILDQLGHPALEGIYWVPPVRFPDGRTMLKIGGDSVPVHIAESDHDITSWFRQGGDAVEAAALLETVRSLLPAATITSSDYKPCVVTYTPTSHPYVEWIDDGIAVALGGSGSAAKSCDEIGRRAGQLVLSDGAV